MERKIEIGVTNLIDKETKYFQFSLPTTEDIEKGCENYFRNLWEKESKIKYSSFFYEQPFKYFTYFINDIG